jgi:hypothetical protein
VCDEGDEEPNIERDPTKRKRKDKKDTHQEQYGARHEDRR